MKAALVVFAFIFVSASAFAQHAADEYFDPAAMQAARDHLKQSHGNQVHSFVQGERLELQADDDDTHAVFEGQGWIGTDVHKAWFKAEGEYALDEERTEEVQLQALYSRAISPFWDLQAGLRHDFKPDPSRSYGVIGLQGLAPLWFEVDASMFVSEQGDISLGFEAEYEIQFSQRVYLQPRVELHAAFADDEDIQVGSGFGKASVGLRLRYEIRREVAPYIGLEWSRAYGDTAKLIRANQADIEHTTVIAGVRFWF